MVSTRSVDCPAYDFYASYCINTDCADRAAADLAEAGNADMDLRTAECTRQDASCKAESTV